MSLRCTNCHAEINYYASHGEILWYECSCGLSWQMGSEKKPPIGIMPRKFWDEQRLQNLSAAINRYLCAGRLVPTEWINEYNELTKRLS